MNRQLDITPRHRALIVLKSILENQFQYTSQKLATLNNVSKDTIWEDINCIKNAGYEIELDTKYRYGIIHNKPYEHLRQLLFISENEFEIIKTALSGSNSSKNIIDKTLKKLENIYDYTKYGSQTITRVYLNKINLLEKAIKEKQKVKLINYKSTNSGLISDRFLEVFHVSPKEDTLQAFDLKHNENRVFKISRFENVFQINEDWENEGKHNLQHFDIFGIANKNLKKIHVIFDIAAFNALVDHYPISRAYISPTADEPNIFELECSVNEDFLGLTNFILGNYAHIIEIVEPQELIECLNDKIKNIQF